MSAVSNLTMNDAATTPVLHTFTPVQTVPNPLWRENISTLPVIGQPRVSLKPTVSNNGGLSKLVWDIIVPALEVSSGQNASGYTAAPKVAFEMRASVVFYIPARSTPAQRKDLRAFVRNLVADGNAQVTDAIENLSPPY